jgi:ribokinase
MRVGVLGHVEMVEFAVVDAMPGVGEIVHAREVFRAPAGGGAVAAVVLRELAGAATLWTTLGDDAVGDEALEGLLARGVDVHATRVEHPTRRCFTHLSGDGERTITVIGPRLQPTALDAAGHEGIYVTAATDDALRAARAARVLTATPRTGPVLARADVQLDVLVSSARDPSEGVDTDGWTAPPRAIVRTADADGGTWKATDGTSGTWKAAPLLGPVCDAYGCGDAFAAALTFALARGATLADACGAAAVEGARRLTLRGPYGDAGDAFTWRPYG